MTEPVVAVLGLGEAGGRLAADLASAGVEVRGYDPAPASTPLGVERIGDPGSAVSGASIVLALTTAATALRRRGGGTAEPGRRRDLCRPEHGVARA